jgi:penicillin-binding protein 1A
VSDTDWSLKPYRFSDAPPPPPEAPRPASGGGGDGGKPPPPPSSPSKKKKKRKGAGRVARAVRVILASLLGLVVVSAIGLGVGAWYVFHDVPEIPAEEALWASQRAPGMTFEDRHGEIIATRGPKTGYRIKLENLPPYVPKAFLAAEDRRFYLHGAVDTKGVARAFVANLRSNRVVQGGSTITQQIAKTLFLKPDRTLKRKLQEAVLAYRLERQLTKDEVLELYLSRVFFGSNAYGLDAAAQTYFGRGAQTLSLSEAALLAGLPQAPSRLALDKNMPAAIERSRLILAAMREEGWITESQETLALANRPALAPPPPGEGDIGYVLDLASAEAARIVGPNAPDLVIRLTIDPALQAQAQDIVRRVMAGDGKRAGASQAALVALSPDGAVRALIGGTDHRVTPFNRAVQAQRQPGSSFKPFVYAAALEAGIKPEDVRQDAPVRYGAWRPTNYGGGYRGAVTVETALVQSINTVAVRLASETGRTKVAELARRFGVESIPPSPNLSVALGAYEVNLLELTGAFGVFQNAGHKHPPFLISSIASSRGDVLFTQPKPPERAIYSRENAGQMVRMMKGVIERGTAQRAAYGRPAAGKTGTSQNWRDAWFVGFTPDWNVGVWVGNDDDSPMTSRSTGGAVPAAIWRAFMITAHGKTPVKDFDFLPPPPPPPPEPEPEPVPALDPVTAERNAFYGDLASDFSVASEPVPEPRRAPPPLRPAPSIEPGPGYGPGPGPRWQYEDLGPRR